MYHLRLSFAFLALAGAVTALGTDAGRAADDFKIEEGYTSLFNGKDLTGWRYSGVKGKEMDGKTETPDKRFMVVDGIIVIDGKGGGDLFSVRDYNKDFNLKLEFRAAPKADSGLYLRSVPAQLQVRDYPTVGPYKKAKFNNGDWNELDVTVKGPIVATTVNGKSVTDKDTLELTVKDGKPTAKLNGEAVDVANISVNVGAEALCKCNGEVIEKAFKCPAKGPIGLQSEVGKFEFRRIRIKELQ
jgi:hypothetical protein